MTVGCVCGAVELRVIGQPIAHLYCHCDDCQAVHGGAYASALYPAEAVEMVRGETDTKILKTTPRTKCVRCGTFLYAQVPGLGVKGVNGALLPQGELRPQFHVQCRYAVHPIEDTLPHFKDLPVPFGGSGELMTW